MLQDLDRTLAELLKHELSPDLVSQVTISFATPDADFPPTAVTLPAINLFLYDLQENWELRQSDWAVERRHDLVTKQRPPFRVDCAYLITAWASEGSSNPAEDEHNLLGEVLKALLRHRQLPAEILQGSLAGQDPPLRAKVLQSNSLQSLGEFWQALGGKPRATLNYTVTVSIAVDKPMEIGPPVRGWQFRESKP